MRPDQLKRLGELEEKLADVFLEEADPDGWAEDGRERYAQRRSATETAQLLARTQALMHQPPNGDRFDPDDQREADRMIERAEKRFVAAAEKAIARAKSRAGA